MSHVYVQELADLYGANFIKHFLAFVQHEMMLEYLNDDLFSATRLWP